MVKLVLALAAGSSAAFAAAVLVAGRGTLHAAGLGLALTLPPAVATLVLAGWGARRWPEAGPTIVMLGTGLRMGWAVVAVSLLGPAVEKLGISRGSLAEWTCGFYLVTLALETALLWRRLARTGRPPPGTDG